jgi:hypothetical protein
MAYRPTLEVLERGTMDFIFYKERIVSGLSGDYKVWAEKERCNSVVRFYARQVGITRNGEHWWVGDEMRRVRFARATNPAFGCVRFDDMIQAIPIMTEEIDLNYLKGMSYHNLRHVKHDFQRFCREIEKVPPNEVRRVT